MNRIPLLFFMSVCVSTIFFSCKDDETTDWDTVEISNAELKTILEQKGFSFDEEGQLVQNDLVLNTTSLDLSGTEISDLSGLDVLPNLTEVDLSDNGYGPQFDFSTLPSTITGVDLAGNEIYDYKGLVDVETEDNGDENVTLLYALNKLYLPVSAKYNCDQLVYFYEQNQSAIEEGSVDMQMADSNNVNATYTTLRGVPDDTLRAYLQENYPSMFDGDSVNIANRIIDASEANTTMSVTKYIGNESIEGAQYIAMSRSFEAGQVILTVNNTDDIKYFKVKSNLYKLTINKINCDVDFSDAESLCLVSINNNNTIETVDLGTSTFFGQRGTTYEFSDDAPSTVILHDCESLSSIVMPGAAEYVYAIQVYTLPLLQEIDLSQFSGIGILKIGNLEGLQNLTYYTPDGYYSYISQDEKGLVFTISPDIYAFESTQTFLNTYHENMYQGSFSRSSGVTTYKWGNDYD